MSFCKPDYFLRVLLISGRTYPRVQYEGGNKTKTGSIIFCLVHCALQSGVCHQNARVMFFQLKHALIAGLIQGRKENKIRYVPQSVVDVQSFGSHCMTLYSHGLLRSQKRPVGNSENRAYGRMDFNRTEPEIIDA